MRVSGDDHARLGDAGDTLVRFEGNRAYMRMEDGHCAALQVARDLEADEGSAGRFVCSVYERRPEVCRNLARGGLSCRGEIAAKGDRPRAKIAELISLTSSRSR